MSYSSPLSKAEGLGNGVTTLWPFDSLVIYATNQIACVKVNLNGTEEDIDPADFDVEVSLDGRNPATGNVRYPKVGSPIPVLVDGEKIIMKRTLDLIQNLIKLENQGGYDPSIVERAIDEANMKILQVQEEIDRAVKVPIGSDIDPDNLIGEVLQAAADANDAADAAEASAELAESWAIDPIGDRPEGSAKSWATADIADLPDGSAKYWATQAQLLAGNFSVERFNGNDTTGPFTLSNQSALNNTQVYIDGVYQQKNSYSIAVGMTGGEITLSEALPTGSVMEVAYTNANVQDINVPGDGTVTNPKLATNSVDTTNIIDDKVTFAKLNSAAFASQSEAEVGTVNNKLMTPLRVAQAIDANYQFALLQDLYSSGTGLAAYTAGGWRTVSLNTEVTDPGNIVSLSSNQFTLQPGTYKITALGAAASAGARFRQRLYNITDAAVLAQGINYDIPGNSSGPAVVAFVTLTTAKTFRLEVYPTGTTAALTASSTGEQEVYAFVAIEKFR